MSNPTSRFSDRVVDYQKYRPSYPLQAIAMLKEHCSLNEQAVIADIGSGTGLFSQQLLTTDAKVLGVEPNDAMRVAAEADLGGEESFTSINGTAEQTGIADASVNLITAAQAFHWFDIAAFRKECLRILKPGGKVALLWNDRLTDSSPFLEGYEQLLIEYGTDYKEVNHRHVDAETIGRFYGNSNVTAETFPNEQRFDWEGLWGRVRSSSYTPAPDAPGFAALTTALRALFDQHAKQDAVIFAYRTQVFVGSLGIDGHVKDI